MTEPGGAADGVRRPTGASGPGPSGPDAVGTGADPDDSPAGVADLPWTSDDDRADLTAPDGSASVAPAAEDPTAVVSHRHGPGLVGRLLADARVRVAVGVAAALCVGLLAGALVFGGGSDAPAAVTELPAASGTTGSTEPPAPAEVAVPVATVAVAPRPTSIAIPDLGIDQPMIDLLVSDDGEMGVPSEWMDIGWWAGGPAPGEAGGTVIAGHVNGGGEPAVFAQLPTLAVGAQVVVSREDGSRATYAVRSKEQFAKDDFPDERVYTLEGPSYLHLVTCGGSFDRRSGHYDDNIVVFAELVGVAAA